MNKVSREKDAIQLCVLCNEVITNLGHNPFPLAPESWVGEDGRACDDCNDTMVIPARLQARGDWS